MYARAWVALDLRHLLDCGVRLPDERQETLHPAIGLVDVPLAERPAAGQRLPVRDDVGERDRADPFAGAEFVQGLHELLGATAFLRFELEAFERGLGSGPRAFKDDVAGFGECGRDLPAHFHAEILGDPLAVHRYPSVPPDASATT
jgi:hypothetical protein